MYNVTVVNSNETGTNTGSIKSYIQNRYDNTTTRPTFILLVGDTDEIPNWVGTYDEDNPATDLDYSKLEGDDMFPDVFLGRFSVHTQNLNNTDLMQLQNIINKTIFTETNIKTFEKNAVFPADEDFWGYFTAGHNHVIDNTFEPEGYTCKKLYADDDATSQDLIDALNEGYRFCIYSGHGSTSGFSDPSLYISDLYNLTNTVFPLGYGFACWTNKYTNNNAFGEAWIRAANGGVTYYGSSHTTWYNDDRILEKKVFGDAFTDDPQVCPMFNIGMHRYWNHWWVSTFDRREKYIQQYNLMGDPSIITTGLDNSCFADYIFDKDIIIESGSDITINADQTIIASENNTDFVVESGANVTLVAGESVILKPGFHAESGSNFHAYIAPCENKTETQLNINKNAVTETDSLKNNKKDFKDFAKAYPNPFKSEFKIEYTVENSTQTKIEIYNIYGMSVYSNTENNKDKGIYIHTCNLENYTSGLYVVKITSGNYIQSIVTLKMK